MYKKLITGTFLILFSLTSFGYSDKPAKLETIEQLIVNGAANIQSKQVKGHSIVNGSLNATNSLFNSLIVNGFAKLAKTKITGTVTVNGSAELNKTTIAGVTAIHGYLSAQNTEILSTLHLSSNKSKLEKCTTKGIVVEKSRPKPQRLYLNNSTIDGDITFLGGHGKVYVCGKTTIAGQVIGGRIKEKC